MPRKSYKNNNSASDQLRQENEEFIKVAVRCRPLNNREKMSGNAESIVDIDPPDISLESHDGNGIKSFQFDYLFDDFASTETVYQETCQDLVESVIEGYDAAVVSYGQTGSGKTFTMQGYGYDRAHRGLVHLSLETILRKVSSSKELSGASNLQVSCFEIYQEKVIDLLVDSREKAERKVREEPKSGVFVQDLTMASVKTEEECVEVIGRGLRNRATGMTLMNMTSSRSHSVISLSLTTLKKDSSSSRTSSILFIDLAGSERASQTGTTGERLKEGANINLSLSSLGSVISALRSSKPSAHVPYRNSKITWILKPCLGGDGKALFIFCISPCIIAYDETLSTLRYANMAKGIKNKPKIKGFDDTKKSSPEDLLTEYKAEIEHLKTKLAISEQKHPATEQKLLAAQKEIQELQNEISNKSSQLENLERKIEEANATIAKYEKQTADAKGSKTCSIL